MARRGAGDNWGMCSLLAWCLCGQSSSGHTPVLVLWAAGLCRKNKPERFMLMTKKVKLGFLPFMLLSLSEVCFRKAWWMERVLRLGL